MGASPNRPAIRRAASITLLVLLKLAAARLVAAAHPTAAPLPLRRTAAAAAGASQPSSSAAAPSKWIRPASTTDSNGGGGRRPRPDVIAPTSSGYITAEKDNGSRLFYVFFEAEEPEGSLETTPILLWLQGGPGCSSMFGFVYLNGPVFVHANMSLTPNPGRWNRKYGTLYIDQPIGTGFSVTGSAPIPREELTVAAHLYAGLQDFYRMHPHYAKRPLYVTGESYAGKYVPSAAHYILQAHATAHGYEEKLNRRRRMDPNIEAPLFPLGGIAIGNGFTDAVSQTLVQAEVAWGMGLIDTRQRRQAEAMQDEVVELVRNKEWRKARDLSNALLAFITNSSALGTLEDVRRDKGYDAADVTTIYLNLKEIKEALGADSSITYVSCSPEVDAAMGHDVMKSTAGLVPDLLAFSNVLLYHGQFDAECGVGSNEAWMSKLAWPGHSGFFNAPREIWRDEAGRALGYWKTFKTMTHIVIRNAGHMVPHDRPDVSQRLIETWVDSTLDAAPHDSSKTFAKDMTAAQLQQAVAAQLLQ